MENDHKNCRDPWHVVRHIHFYPVAQRSYHDFKLMRWRGNHWDDQGTSQEKVGRLYHYRDTVYGDCGPQQFVLLFRESYPILPIDTEIGFCSDIGLDRGFKCENEHQINPIATIRCVWRAHVLAPLYPPEIDYVIPQHKITTLNPVTNGYANRCVLFLKTKPNRNRDSRKPTKVGPNHLNYEKINQPIDLAHYTFSFGPYLPKL